MTYFEPDRWGEQKLSARFVADLATAMGGVDVDTEYQGGAFTVDGVRIILRQGWGAKARRVLVVSTVADKDLHRLAHAAGRPVAFPDATVDPERPIETIAKDLQKRIVDKAAPAMASIRNLADVQTSREAELKRHADAINDILPGAVTPEPGKWEAPVYVARGSFRGRLASTGTLYVDYLSIPADKVVAVLKLLTEG